MRELRFVGLSDDESAILMGDGAGHQFSLGIDEQLTAAVRRDTSTIARQENSMKVDGALRPRDIQSRIRAGASVNDIVAASGLDLDHVERYASPILAERAHIASTARETEVQREQTAGLVLAAAVAQRLADKGIEESNLAWDAWRREDGRWIVRASYPHGRQDRSAHWLFDPKAGSLVADDAEARWLIDPQADEPQADERQSKPRLAAVVSLADREIEDEPLIDDLEDELENDSDELTGAGAPDELPDQAGSQVDGDVLDFELGQSANEGAAEPEAVEKPTPTRRPATKKSGRARRAAVPSWDDIMFGAKRDDE